jgi:hypothetical protein
MRLQNMRRRRRGVMCIYSAVAWVFFSAAARPVGARGQLGITQEFKVRAQQGGHSALPLCAGVVTRQKY